jgi:hypothetical protein
MDAGHRPGKIIGSGEQLQALPQSVGTSAAWRCRRTPTT